MNTDPNRLAQDAARSPQAFAILYDLYFPRVYNYVRYRCGDPDTADELTSQIFERLLEKIGRFSSTRGSFEPWLFTLARNILADYYRSPRSRWISLEDLPHPPAYDPSLEERVIQKEAEAGLLQAVNRLDERSRDLLGLKFGAQLTNRQIAGLAGLSESNVAVILYRAIAQLRASLQESEPAAPGRRSRK